MKNKKSSEKINQALEAGKRREVVTVNIIKYNRSIGKLSDALQSGLKAFRQAEHDLGEHADLYNRIKMTERVVVSAMRMIAQNKLQFFMIDENVLFKGDD